MTKLNPVFQAHINAFNQMAPTHGGDQFRVAEGLSYFWAIVSSTREAPLPGKVGASPVYKHTVRFPVNSPGADLDSGEYLVNKEGTQKVRLSKRIGNMNTPIISRECTVVEIG